MVWNFLKKILNKKEQNTRISAAASPAGAPPASGPEEPAIPPSVRPGRTDGVVKQTAAPSAEKPAYVGAPADMHEPVKEKPHAEKTDEELAREINAISPEILSQAKTPQTRKLVIDIYRRMLIEGVDIKDEKEVKRWLKKHPEAVTGCEARKIETFKREEPKVGRNDACPCGSGRKYKKCCGKGK